MGRPLGGQAVIEGVMMRGATVWAVAARLPDQSIAVDVRPAPTSAQQWEKIPLVRGVASLVESMALGLKALSWAADQQTEPDERPSSAAVGVSLAVALSLFSAVFILIPAFAARLFASHLPGGAGFAFAEGVIRLGLFLGYISLIGRLPDIRRVFQYHGAEHKAIAAYENDVPITVSNAQRFTTEHVRCGTNFLLTVMIIAMLAHSVFGRPSWPVLIVSRIVLLPVVAGVSYELIRFAATNMHRRWVRRAMRPGLALQRLTTREPADDQVEVAITALLAVLSVEERAEVEARAAA